MSSDNVKVVDDKIVVEKGSIILSSCYMPAKKSESMLLRSMKFLKEMEFNLKNKIYISLEIMMSSH